MRVKEILALPSMPLAGPSYPRRPYRFVDREYMIISYETDPDIVREQLPEPLEPLDAPLVHYEWILMPDSSGFGSYTESGLVIGCRYKGEEMNFVSQMYLDDDPPIAAGREIWGFPKKYAHPKLAVVKDTLTVRSNIPASKRRSEPWAISTRAWPATASRRRLCSRRRKSI
jgi:acetoacetate decarboxylase